MKKENYLLFGLLLFLISALLFAITEMFPFEENRGDLTTTTFFVHYFISGTYFLVLLYKRKLKLLAMFVEQHRSQHIILLLLFNIGAYALNKTIPIFDESVGWLSVILIIETIALLYLAFYPEQSKTKSQLVSVLLAFMIVFHIYQTIVVIPYFIIGVIGIPFFGISLHILVPLFYVILTIQLMITHMDTMRSWIAFSSSLAVIIGIISIYSFQWYQLNQKVQDTQQSYFVPGKPKELPDWVRISQQIPNNNITLKYLGSEFLYSTFNSQSGFFSFDLGMRFENQKKHDPLVSIASLFGGECELPREDRIKILNYFYNARHQTTDRFWSGQDLETTEVITNIQFFPSYRLAFTELFLKVKNHNKRNWSQQEAIYTFDLPKGSVVSALSLWIEGVEQEGILTTKSKAETAYNTIVGRERRDPSVIYWMEGNQIRVRVFPCTPEEERRFKIGITTPLNFEKGELKYEPITFLGPDNSAADMLVTILGQPKGFESNLDFQLSEKYMQHESNYSENWFIEFNAPTLSKKSFEFNDEFFEVSNYEPLFQDFSAKYIYFDINNSWTSGDTYNAKNIKWNAEKTFVHKKGLREDAQLDFEKGPTYNFNLFPFHKVRDNSLIVTKSSEAGPNLSDLEDTEFKSKIFEYFETSRKPIKVFDLATQSSNYLLSLAELGVIELQQGDWKELTRMVETSRFQDTETNKNEVIIPESGIKISKVADGKSTANSPDHLLRLFAYQKILNGIGKNYFKQDYLNEELAKESAIANIVTPVSSLIVLETQHDYERFGIEKTEGSLGNAAINQSGAVPEPHEWALIILGSLFLAFLVIKRIGIL